MYHFLRRIHLFSGLVILVFLLMYFVSGYVMIHDQWFPRPRPQKTTRTEPLHFTGSAGTAEFVNYLEQTFAIHGKRQEPKHPKDGSWKFNYVRPGMNYEVLVAPDGRTATITQLRFNAVGTLHGLHRLHGYGGGALYWLWSLLYDLASASLILFALTGICLWYQSTARHWPGWICLGGSFGFTAAMILYLMFSR